MSRAKVVLSEHDLRSALHLPDDVEISFVESEHDPVFVMVGVTGDLATHFPGDPRFAAGHACQHPTSERPTMTAEDWAVAWEGTAAGVTIDETGDYWPDFDTTSSADEGWVLDLAEKLPPPPKLGGSYPSHGVYAWQDGSKLDVHYDPSTGVLQDVLLTAKAKPKHEGGPTGLLPGGPWTGTELVSPHAEAAAKTHFAQWVAQQSFNGPPQYVDVTSTPQLSDNGSLTKAQIADANYELAKEVEKLELTIDALTSKVHDVSMTAGKLGTEIHVTYHDPSASVLDAFGVKGLSPAYDHNVYNDYQALLGKFNAATITSKHAAETAKTASETTSEVPGILAKYKSKLKLTDGYTSQAEDDGPGGNY